MWTFERPYKYVYIYICVLNWRVSLVFQPSILALSQNHRCSSCGAESLPFLNIYRLGSQPICVKQQCHAGGIMLIHHHMGVDWWIKIRVRNNTSIWSSFLSLVPQPITKLGVHHFDRSLPYEYVSQTWGLTKIPLVSYSGYINIDMYMYLYFSISWTIYIYILDHIYNKTICFLLEFRPQKEKNKNGRQIQTPSSSARWAPSSYKWSYNPYKWLYKWLTVRVTLVIGVINPSYNW